MWVLEKIGGSAFSTEKKLVGLQKAGKEVLQKTEIETNLVNINIDVRNTFLFILIWKSCYLSWPIEKNSQC